MKVVVSLVKETSPLSLSHFNSVTSEDAAQMIARINPAEGVLELRAEECLFAKASPTFYPDCELFWIRNDSWECDLYYASTPTGEFTQLNGTSPPIHKFNERYLDLLPERVEANPELALSYLEYFCFFVRGDDGPFYVLTERDLDRAVSLSLKSPPRDEADLRRIRDLYRGPSVHRIEPDGKILASALLWYSNYVFLADFVILPSGMVEMAQDFPIVELSQDAGAPPASTMKRVGQARARMPAAPTTPEEAIAAQKRFVQLLKEARGYEVSERAARRRLTSADGAATVTINGLGELVSLDISGTARETLSGEALQQLIANTIIEAQLLARRDYLNSFSTLLEKYGGNTQEVDEDRDAVERQIKRLKGESDETQTDG